MEEAVPPRLSDRVDTRTLRVVDLGVRRYQEILELQRRLAGERRETPPDHDLLLLVEHPPVITLGRGSDPQNIIALPNALSTHGVEVTEIERGGDVTYHGPGQLVGYPIFDLHAYRLDLHWYLRRLEEVLLRVLGHLDLPGYRVAEHTGVWTGDPPPSSSTTSVEEDGFVTVSSSEAPQLIIEQRIRKIGSIGIHASRWITWHGFALNVTDEPLEHFSSIIPCGINGVKMTSLVNEGVQVSVKEVQSLVLQSFDETFPSIESGWASETTLTP